MTDDRNDPDAIARRLRWNHKTFQAYNIGRIREVMRYLPQRRMALFQAVPFLLHVNHPDLTGFVDDPGAVFGIQRFHYSGFWKQGLKQFGLSSARMRPYLSASLAIEGLYLMGSLGTLAQTPQSDMDYWVITRRLVSDAARLTMLRRKLDRIARWGLEVFDQHITFFVLDAEQVTRNAFAAVDDESSGSAQRTLLKEEFYRTFVFVAGRLPYWAVMPPRISAATYAATIEQARKSTLASYDDEDYIDLGHVDRIDPGECQGAMLWQLYKARRDPVKALIKSSLIGHYLFCQEAFGLLCDEIKAGYSHTSASAAAVDPYAAVFQRAAAFFDWIQDDPGRHLIRQCIYLRLIGFPKKQSVAAGSPKAALRARLVSEWAWSDPACADMDAYHRWPAKRWRDMEERIIHKLGFILDLIQTHAQVDNVPIDMTPDDLTELKGRISAVFKRRKGKVGRCPCAIRVRAGGRLVMYHDPDEEKAWRIRFSRNGGDITAASDAVPLVGWLVRNRVVSAASPSIAIHTRDRTQPLGRIDALVRTAAEFFDPPGTAVAPFRRFPVMDRLLVSLFSRAVFSDDQGLTAAYLWRNTWGEFFYDADDLSSMDSHWTRLHTVAARIHRFQAEGGEAPGTFRIMDCRLSPEPRLPAIVADMVRTMDHLDSDSVGGGETGDRGPGHTPILDLL